MKKINSIISTVFFILSIAFIINLLLIYITKKPSKVYGEIDTFLTLTSLSVVCATIAYGFLKNKKWLIYLYTFALIVYYLLMLNIITINAIRELISIDGIKYLIIFLIIPVLIEVYLIVLKLKYKDIKPVNIQKVN